MVQLSALVVDAEKSQASTRCPSVVVAHVFVAGVGVSVVGVIAFAGIQISRGTPVRVRMKAPLPVMEADARFVRFGWAGCTFATLAIALSILASATVPS
jgi:hypothetical protein